LITLVSYPRSGNTFLRNVLYEVYGLESKTYHLQKHGPDSGWQAAPIVKTHELPEDLPAELVNRKVVYLIRDGRDAIVSMAHHRADVFDKGSNFNENLLEAINADEGSYFGGWTKHVLSWINRADLVIRFEDLIRDPIGECERLRSIMKLPEPSPDRLPSFQDLKHGQPEYGSGKNLPGDNLATFWFRKGKVNGWKYEMSNAMHDRFWHLHGEAMEYAGYSHSGDLNSDQTEGALPDNGEMTVIIEASKITDFHTDGIKRYVVELIKTAECYPVKGLSVKVLVDGALLDLKSAIARVGDQRQVTRNWVFMLAKNVAKWLLPKGMFNALARNKNHPIFRKVSSNINNEKLSVNADVVHLTLPQHYGHIDHIQTKGLVATIHDLTHDLMSETHTDRNAELSEVGMRYLDEKQATLISVSEHTKADLLKTLRKSQRIYEGVDRRRFYPLNNQHWNDLIYDRYNNPHKPFFLSVSTLEPRKNIASLINAYALLDEKLRDEYPLVLAGKKGWKWNSDIVPKHCKGSVHFIGFVDERHLTALYSAAYAFCYVSYYEGFGLPVLEAMACACPVIASNNTSLAEIVNDSGILVDPNSVDSIKAGLEKMMDDKTRNEFSDKAMKRSWDFTWRKCWEETVKVYSDSL